jgi:TRAP-type C4-dicarboxylate transport system substrate-binding protein
MRAPQHFPRVAQLAAVTAMALVAALVLPAASQAQDKVFKLSLSHPMSPSHPLQKSLEDWGAAVEKASGGTLKYNVFPAMQLGKPVDQYDMARDGGVDLTYVTPGLQPGRFPIIAAAELPFLISDAKGGSEALDAWYRKYVAREMRDVKYCLAFIHDPGSFHSNKKIVLPADIKGLKVRPANATMGTFVSQLGGVNVQSSASEVRDLLEKGMADSVTFPWGLVVPLGIDKVTKFHIDAPLYVTSSVLVFNKDKYTQMSATQKKAIDDNCTTEMAGKIGEHWGVFDHDGIAKVKTEAGHEVYPLTADQLAQWKQAAEPLENTWANNVRQVGIDPATAMKEFKEELARHHAGPVYLAEANKPLPTLPAAAAQAPDTTSATLPQPQAAPQMPRPEPASRPEAAPPSGTTEQRVALVIGNSAYRSVAVLPNPRRDAKAVSDALRQVGFQSVELALDLDLDAMLKALRKFREQADRADWALIYFAGHGIEIDRVNYLIPTDAKLLDDRDVKRETVSYEDLVSAIGNAKALRLIILDACRNNPFKERMRRNVASRSATDRGLAPPPESEPGTLVVYSAKEGEVAADDVDGVNSPFTRAFIAQVKVPGREVRRLFDLVRDDVMDATNKRQQPYTYGSVSGRRDFYFVAGK